MPTIFGCRSNNEIGDFAARWSAGFYLDYTSAARYASLHYDTFAQLFLHQTQFDRAGEGQFVTATDDENLSPTTKLRLDEFFYRDAPTEVTDHHQRAGSAVQHRAGPVVARERPGIDQSVQRDVVALLGDAAGPARFRVHQTTFWVTMATSNNGQHNTSYDQGISTYTDYHFS